MSEKMENKFEQVLRAENPVNYTDIKVNIIERNVTLKITLTKRWKKKWQKFKRKKRVVRQPKRSSNKVSDFIELTLKLSKFNNVTENRKLKKKTKGVTYRRKRMFYFQSKLVMSETAVLMRQCSQHRQGAQVTV